MTKILGCRRGFTFMELIVVIIIIAILSSIAFPMFQRAIERMRIGDAVLLFGTELASQDRHALTKHRYTKRWAALDAAPVEVHSPINTDGSGNGYLNYDGTVFYTRGGEGLPNAERKPGYAVEFQEFADNRWYMVATRVGDSWGGYKYTLVRPFDTNQVTCIPNMDHDDSVRVCLDFMGVDSPDQLPSDPRPLL